MMQRRKAPAGDGWRIEHLLLSWDAASHAVANVHEGIANHRIPSEVWHFLGQVALMALLMKNNPDDPFAAPAISNGIRPIGKTHVFHQAAFRPLALSSSAETTPARGTVRLSKRTERRAIGHCRGGRGQRESEGKAAQRTVD